MPTENPLQYLLVDDDSPYVPALPAGPAGGEPEGGEGPGPPPLLLLTGPGGGGQQVTELRRGVVTSESALLHLQRETDCVHIVISKLSSYRREIKTSLILFLNPLLTTPTFQ